MAGDGRGGGDAGDNFVGDAGCAQCADFFDQVAEQAGIAPFEPHDGASGLGQLDQPAIDFVLRQTWSQPCRPRQTSSACAAHGPGSAD